MSVSYFACAACAGHTKLTASFERIDRALRRSLGVSETAQAPSNVDAALPGATGEPEADPETILQSEELVDWQNMKKHLADPKVFDKTPDEDEPGPPVHDRVEQETGYQIPSTASDVTEATSIDCRPR